MKILEAIEIRAAHDNIERVDEYVNNWIEECKGFINEISINNYRNLNIGTDYCVTLSYLREDERIEKSIGKQLSQNLKEFGLVSYSVWIGNELIKK